MMHHPYLHPRLYHLQKILMESFNSSKLLSSNSKGSQRELFVNTFLKEIFPPAYRFGTGDITDCYKNKSGQVDIVIETPHYYSFPAFIDGPRLYLAEGVSVVIEVKSNAEQQWVQVGKTAKKLKELKRRFRNQFLDQMGDKLAEVSRNLNNPKLKNDSRELKLLAESMIDDAPERIPFYVVSYEGFEKRGEMTAKLKKSKVDGLFVISDSCFRDQKGFGRGIDGMLTFIDELFVHMKRPVVVEQTFQNYGSYSSILDKK